MGLSDIFAERDGNSGHRIASAADAALSEVEAALHEKASRVVDLSDRLSKATNNYKAQREILLREVEQQLSDLKRDMDGISEQYGAAKDELMSDMDSAGVSKIPVEGRDPVRIKTTAGRKRSITRKWLVEEFGEASGKNIWSKVPNGPGSRDLVIPPPYDDQPSD